MPTNLSEAQESYVETIFRLESEQGVARVKVVASALQVSAPSVTKTVKGLSELGLVQYRRYGVISLTEAGRTIGRDLLLRYRATEDFLRSLLGVSAELAQEVADSFEHNMPASVLCRLVQFVDHYKNNVENKFTWTVECAHLCSRYDRADCVLEQSIPKENS